MKIKILGTRGEIDISAPYHSKKSGVLINNTLLLDIGDASFLTYKPKHILITHLHPDHAYFVRNKEMPNIKAKIYAPEKYENLDIHITNRLFKIDGYTIKPIPTIHSLLVKSNAYLIEYKSKRILYTGDMVWIEKKYHKYLKNLDLVITEGSYIRKGGLIRRNKESGKVYGHTGIPNLINLFKKFTNTILLTHFGSWFYENMQQSRKDIALLAKQNDINIIVGYDGLQITI